MFGSNFLPTPQHVEEFKSDAKKRFFGSLNTNAIQRNQILFLDCLDAIANLLKVIGWPVEEQKEYLQNLLKLDMWNPSVFDDFRTPDDFIAALENALDVVPSQGQLTEVVEFPVIEKDEESRTL